MRPIAIAVAALATAVACGPTAAPELDGLSDQVAQVGQQLIVQLNGTDPAGGRLVYAYDAPDVTDIAGNAQVTVAPSGEGVFEWTPLADDVGAHPFDFTVTNAGGAKTTVTITIDVKSAIGAGSAPVFRQPLGTGTTIDIAQTPCVTLQVVVEDQATANVTLAQEQPLIIGATITQVDGQDATWKWCPTVSQAMESRYTLVLSADDGTNPKTLKDYLIVVRDSGAGSCPGAGPSIAHTPADQTTRLDLPLVAQVTDAAGLKDTPLLYYSSTDPGPTPNLSTMTQLSATLTSGDNTNGSWTATVPNPVAAAADGTAQTIYYVFVAEDHDQADNCDHVTQSQVYSMTVTAGGSSTAGLCQACTADSQCGDGNECVYIGDMGASYCLASCDAGCADGYSCSASDIYSVDGESALQCVPQSGSCIAPTAPCDNDDGWHPNQTMSEASANGVMDAGDWTELVSCPSPTDDTRAEDDWFKIELDAQSTLDIYLYGDGATDLDLHLYDSSGDVIDASTSSTPDEELHECLGAYVYYVKVNGYGYARSVFELDIDETPADTCD